MKKNVGIWMAIVFGFILLLTACGEKSQEDVVKKLEEKLDGMDGYKAKAEMTMNTGKEDHKFQIDIWHKKKDLYRVALKNEKDEKGSQVILKNEDGVFVLTPALNKSFKFQTEWPQNSSQPYLYQSLVRDVIQDKEATFKVGDSQYIFQTKTNYQSNNNLPYQEIHFDKKTYTPTMVKVMDKDKKALVEVKFSNFDMKPTFKDDDFDMKENMTSGNTDIPVSGDEQTDTLTVLTPMYMAGAELDEKKEVALENGQRVIMTFTGEKNFTLVQERKDVIPTFSSPKEVTGDIVNLGHSVGALTDNTIEWASNGVNFYLASEELTNEELIEVAKSVQGKEVK